jgi:hypothetical protein
VKFLLDAQLPRRATEWFRAAGADAIHTLDLPGRSGAVGILLGSRFCRLWSERAIRGDAAVVV